MQLKNIAVVGPRGNVGAQIIRKLLEDDNFNITAVLRPTSKYQPPPEKVRCVVADFDDQPSLAGALQNQDALVCCVPGGQTKFAQQKLLIDAAIDAGVELFFPSEFVSNILSPQFAIFPTQVVGDKPKVRHYLEEKAAAGEITYTALNGGPFFDMWLMLGPAGFNISARKATIYGTGNNPACWTPLPTIAAAVVNMLRNPDSVKNRGIFVAGVKDVTQNALLAALEEEIGEKFEVEHADVWAIKKEAHAALDRGEYMKANRGLVLNSNFNEVDSVANFWDKTENDLVGVKVVSVQEAVKTVLASWKKT